MQIGTRVRYGMLAMMDLARRGELHPVRAVDIASETGLSRGYLLGLLAALRRRGLVRAVRGPGGGWRLARPARRLRPEDVYVALEGPTALAPCAERPTACEYFRRCGAGRLWMRMTRALERALREESLAALAGTVRRRASTRRPKKKRALSSKKAPRRRARPRVILRRRVLRARRLRRAA